MTPKIVIKVLENTNCFLLKLRSKDKRLEDKTREAIFCFYQLLGYNIKTSYLANNINKMMYEHDLKIEIVCFFIFFMKWYNENKMDEMDMPY